MLGQTLSAVTLDHGALADNFLKVKLASHQEANRLIDVKIGGLTVDGVSESGALTVLT